MSISGKNVVLRPICLDDTHVLCTWKNTEELYMFLGGGFQPISEDQYKKWVESMIDQTGSDRRFIIENAEQVPIGMVGLYGINWIHRTCEIGAFIGDVAFRRKGYASEACKLLEAYATSYLNLRKIRLKVVCDNAHALLFWQNLGYTQAGLLRDERFINGKYCDVAIMEKFITPSASDLSHHR